ncbi:hypothetical protein M9H77_23763 [Catharanthus roseus]|uniref:Uncharacterized protein n=1 Tax=Catharanthus roseus TaxID=4058 RepID=A0ACC0AVR3_CATRO|nr:hypothetical protein M9H77_23763 [Catharanthus roseus]
MNLSIFLILLNGTSNWYFSNVRKIQQLIEKNLTNEDEVVENMATFMFQKFKKYWDCCSIVLSSAIILDPWYKISHVGVIFQYLDSYTAEAKVKNVRDKLYSLFDEYMQFVHNPCFHTSDTGGSLNECCWG